MSQAMTEQGALRAGRGEDIPRTPMVHVNRERTGDGIRNLFTLIDELELRLSPVLVDLGPAPKGGSDAMPVPQQSDVAGHLDGFANDLQLLQARLRALLQRLDV